MWRRWLRNMRIEWYWIKRDIIRHWSLGTPAGIMGIITIILGLLFIIIVGDAIAHMFRLFVPWLSGSKVSEIYWKTLGFGVKISSVFLLFSASLILYFLLKYSNRR